MSDNGYWKSLEEIAANRPAAVPNEFSESVMSDPIDRRGFLKASGFTLAGTLMLGGCSRGPVEKAIPYLVQPEEIVPGRATWYATTCAACAARCGALVKSREGRPIKLEGNPDHAFSGGGLCAVGQASLLELYDSYRLRGPRLDDRPATWEEVDRAITSRLTTSAARVRILTDSITSPTEKALIERFLARFEDGRHVVYDPLSSSAILDAHQATHGQRSLPRYDFARADLILSFGADFLGTWISPVEFTAAYRRGRELAGELPRLSYHVQFEGRLSLTGSNADLRVRIDPQDTGLILGHLVRRVAGSAAPIGFGDLPPAPVDGALLDDLAGRLLAARGRTLVVSASQSRGDQVLVNTLNELLGAYGSTLDLVRPSYQLQGDDRALHSLLGEIESGGIDLLLVRGVNPVYDLPTPRLAAALEALPFVVSFAGSMDETAALADANCPESHFLESWRDSEPVAGVVSVGQPAIEPLFDTRTFAECLARWSGERALALELIQQTWREAVLPRSGESSFQRFWDRTVQSGSATVEAALETPSPFDTTAVESSTAGAEVGALTLELYPKISMRDGRHAHNPWLQELPDPITKVVWDNYAALSPATAERLGLAQNDIVRLETGDGIALELPVYLQPGQHDAVVAVALGYGRSGTDRFSNVAPRWLQMKSTVEPGGTIGRNAAPLSSLDGSGRRWVRADLRLSRVGTTHALASTQAYNYLSVPAALAPTTGEDRPIIQETVLPAYLQNRAAGAPHLHHFESDLWGEHEFATHQWAMAIDLSACTGCSACVISCQAENNIPVVGRDEVRRRRDMHWIRIDRYYRGQADNPDTAHQPMLCHHCDNAPCETVCPVVATLHSSEGLNMQAYNRCVGTRYCANNCPYKVRRFNWFDYAHDDEIRNLVLNPDVVVRERGVMEKCSFCVQRIQEAKFVARGDDRPVADGDIQTACQQSCPAQAIVFGDLKDPESRISRMRQDPRHYLVFEELNVKPSVGYLRLVRNRAVEPGTGESEETHHG